MKKFLAENNLPDMLGSILLDNSVNKARLLSLTAEECENLGLGSKVAAQLFRIGVEHRQKALKANVSAEGEAHGKGRGSEHVCHQADVTSTPPAAPAASQPEVRRFLNDQHLQATLSSIQRLQVKRSQTFCVGAGQLLKLPN